MTSSIDWLPMSTAPRDGSAFLALSEPYSEKSEQHVYIDVLCYGETEDGEEAWLGLPTYEPYAVSLKNYHGWRPIPDSDRDPELLASDLVNLARQHELATERLAFTKAVSSFDPEKHRVWLRDEEDA